MGNRDGGESGNGGRNDDDRSIGRDRQTDSSRQIDRERPIGRGGRTEIDRQTGPDMLIGREKQIDHDKQTSTDCQTGYQQQTSHDRQTPRDGNPGQKPGVSRCSVCDAPAVFLQRSSGRHFCSDHLAEDLRDRVRATIQSHGMIRDGDRIAVGLSGGKDSSALLLILSQLVMEWRDVSLVAVTIDEGIAGYRDETMEAARSLAARLGVPHRIASFSDLFGKSLDELLRGKEERACSVCGILRRRALVLAAGDADANRIATGHNLDDEAQSALMNVLRGDLARLMRESGEETVHFIPRIKPLRGIDEREISAFLMATGAWQDLPECPYTHHALRFEIRTLLAGFEQDHPGTMKNIITARTRLRERLKGKIKSEPIGRCRSCGEASSGELCQSCQLLATLGIDGSVPGIIRQ